MSGFFENWYEPKMRKFVSSIPWLPELKIEGEQKLAASHIFYMAFMTLIWPALSAAFKTWWLSFGSILSFALIVIAEGGKNGRKIDWITRSTGWAIGFIPSIIVILRELI